MVDGDDVNKHVNVQFVVWVPRNAFLKSSRLKSGDWGFLGLIFKGITGMVSHISLMSTKYQLILAMVRYPCFNDML